MATLHLYRNDEGEWYTTGPDGRTYIIGMGTAVTVCDEPHPVRLAREDWTVKWDGTVVKGYLCEGDQDHEYTLWGVVIHRADGQYDGQGEPCDTQREAIQDLARMLGCDTVKRHLGPRGPRAKKPAPPAWKPPAWKPEPADTGQLHGPPAPEPRTAPVWQLQPGQIVEAICPIGPGRYDGWIIPLGFPARLSQVKNNGDGTITLTLDTEHWDKNRHVPGEWLVRLA